MKDACKSETSIMSNGVKMFGCPIYKESQEEACDCHQWTAEEKALLKLKQGDRKKLLTNFYAKQ